MALKVKWSKMWGLGSKVGICLVKTKWCKNEEKTPKCRGPDPPLNSCRSTVLEKQGKGRIWEKKRENLCVLMAEQVSDIS